MRRVILAGMLALGFGGGAVVYGAADDDIRLSGCLVRGENGEGYLLTNVPGEAAWQRAADPAVVPGPVGRPAPCRASSTGSTSTKASTITSDIRSKSKGG